MVGAGRGGVGGWGGIKCYSQLAQNPSDLIAHSKTYWPILKILYNGKEVPITLFHPH